MFNTNFPETVSRWLASKSPRSSQFKLSQHNIYVFPTQAGLLFLALLLLMLVTAINYQSSLIYLMTFVLGVVFFISIWLCFLNLSGLRVSSYEQAECFSGERCPVHVRLFSEHKPAFAVFLGTNKQDLVFVNINSGVMTDVTLFDNAAARGLRVVERVRIESSFPFGLIRAWTWLKLDARTMVYPKPLQSSRSASGSDTEQPDDSRQKTDDLTELRAYQNGDTSARIVWKHYAAKEQLVVRTQEQGGVDSNWLRWTDYETQNVELKLSYLCFEVLNLTRKNQVFGLDLPGTRIGPANDEAHQKKCLTALALFGCQDANYD